MISDIVRPNWDEWFMSMAFLVSARSPDPDTKHGAVLCNDRHQVLGVGYNGFVRGVDDSLMPLTRPHKYFMIVHSEVNCLMNSQNLISSNNCVMYITGFPCSNCFMQIAQNNIKSVVYGPVSSKCIDESSMCAVLEIAKQLDISLRYFGGPFMEKIIPDKYKYIEGICVNPFEEYVGSFKRI